MHEKPTERGSWAPHGVDGWYIGPAIESHRCFKTYMWSTKAERITDTLEWFPHYQKMPSDQASDATTLLSATKDILKTLKHPSPNGPTFSLDESTGDQIQTATELLNKQLQSPTKINSQQEPTATPQRVATPNPAPALRVDTPVERAPIPGENQHSYHPRQSSPSNSSHTHAD